MIQTTGKVIKFLGLTCCLALPVSVSPSNTHAQAERGTHAGDPLGPVCNNGVAEEGEECDGDDDAACTGNPCLDDCTCGGPPNDDCADSMVITNGDTPFNTAGATTDGPDLFPFCDMGPFGDDINHRDMWYDYHASCTGGLLVTTCDNDGGMAGYDTRLAVYDACACPADPATVLGCSDDAHLCELQSTVQVPVAAGNCYKIQVGGFSEANVGSGLLHIECDSEFCNDACTWNTDPEADAIDPDGLQDVDAANLGRLLWCWGAPMRPDPLCECLDRGAGGNSPDGNILGDDLAGLLGAWSVDGNGNGIPDNCSGG